MKSNLNLFSARPELKVGFYSVMKKMLHLRFGPSLINCTLLKETFSQPLEFKKVRDNFESNSSTTT